MGRPRRDWTFFASCTPPLDVTLAAPSLPLTPDNLMPALGEDWRGVADNLWAAIETEISPDQCEIYSYSGDAMSDPFSAEGALWSFAYFFYNKQKRRVVLFACCGFR